MFISAIPSFVLSLQPNTERVKGRFIPYVLSRAIPGALTMVLGILTLYVIQKSSLATQFFFIDELGSPTLSYQALMMLSLTFSGLVMLYRVCQPFNLLRVSLFIFTAFLCIFVVSIPVLGEIIFVGWSTLEFALPQILLIIIIVLVSFPVSSVLIKLFDMITVWRAVHF